MKGCSVPVTQMSINQEAGPRRCYALLFTYTRRPVGGAGNLTDPTDAWATHSSEIS